ncbi:phosphate starvation-inducible protein PhoH [Candidatus Atribacteria bacterium RBG_16_35_8]|nr:MAG: phosphate starvation-inducible protein PhoH [Candidatus Atribacteria bacterium RBG_16_35_8]
MSHSILIDNKNELRELFGQYDENIKLINQYFSIRISTQNDSKLVISGIKRETDKAVKIIEGLLSIIRNGHPLSIAQVKYHVEMSQNNQPVDCKLLFKDVIRVFKKDKEIKPKTLGQQKYIETVRKNDIVFVIGPAGTGKTYLAVAIALSALKNEEVDRIILVRPAVEAGESLGYLPGDLLEKIDPYFRPLYDAIYEMMPSEKFQKYMEKGIIEIAPLGYMRGRTLNNSFIILDDAQNTTLGQMKMFLTRFGFGSKVIINGDITQIDLPLKEHSGLTRVERILKKIKGIEFVYLNDQDVVRHRLVQEIIRAYERDDLRNQKKE